MGTDGCPVLSRACDSKLGVGTAEGRQGGSVLLAWGGEVPGTRLSLLGPVSHPDEDAFGSLLRPEQQSNVGTGRAIHHPTARELGPAGPGVSPFSPGWL